MSDQRHEILLKELDLIDKTITRLDRQMLSSKTLCISLWTAWIGWFLVSKSDFLPDFELGVLILFSAIFPMIFWKVDSLYRGSLLSTSNRRNLISLYLNAPGTQSDFLLMDPVGWLYKSENYEGLIESMKEHVEPKKLRQMQDPSLGKYSYKDALWFYLPLVIISILFGTYLLVQKAYICGL